MTEANLLRRAMRLLETTRFMTLATRGERTVWASTLNYVPVINEGVRLLWYSMRDARHSRYIDVQPGVAGSLFRTDLGGTSPLGLDGLQFTGSARITPDKQVPADHERYYSLNFPDITQRRKWMLPVETFLQKGPRAFYSIVIEDWWLLDIDQWLLDKQDQRIALPSPTQTSATLRRLSATNNAR